MNYMSKVLCDCIELLRCSTGILFNGDNVNHYWRDVAQPRHQVQG